MRPELQLAIAALLGVLVEVLRGANDRRRRRAGKVRTRTTDEDLSDGR